MRTSGSLLNTNFNTAITSSTLSNIEIINGQKKSSPSLSLLPGTTLSCLQTSNPAALGMEPSMATAAAAEACEISPKPRFEMTFPMIASAFAVMFCTGGLDLCLLGGGGALGPAKLDAADPEEAAPACAGPLDCSRTSRDLCLITCDIVLIPEVPLLNAWSRNTSPDTLRTSRASARSPSRRSALL